VCGQVVLFAEQDREAAPGGVAGDSRPVDPSADHQQVESVLIPGRSIAFRGSVHGIAVHEVRCIGGCVRESGVAGPASPDLSYYAGFPKPRLPPGDDSEKL
jgi:hypothetical protein